MANLTQEKKQEMQNTAGFSSESLAERFNQELERATNLRDNMEALAPSQHRTAEMIGDTSDLPEGMSPTQTRLRGTAAGTAFAAAQSQYGQANVLEILGQMMQLQQDSRSAEQDAINLKLKQEEYNQLLAKRGLKLDEFGQPVGMTDEELASAQLYSGDPVVWLKSQPGGLKIAKNETTVTGLETTAEAIYNAGGIAKYLDINPDAMYSNDEQKALSAKKDTLFNVRTALAYFDDNGRAPGVGPFTGLFGNLFIGKEGETVRENIAQISNEKIKEMSGAAVSDKEAKRLMQQLPNKTDKDSTIKRKLQAIEASIVIGEELKKIALVEEMGSIDEAYLKYGPELYEALGQEVPKWLTDELAKKPQAKTKNKTAKDYANEIWQ